MAGSDAKAETLTSCCFFFHCPLSLSSRFRSKDFFVGKIPLCWNNEYKLVFGKFHPVPRCRCDHGSGTEGENQNVWRTRNVFACTSALVLHEPSEVTGYSLDSLIWLSFQDHSLSPPCCSADLLYLFHISPVVPMDLYPQPLPGLGAFNPFQQVCRALRSDKTTAFRCGRCCFR